MMQELQIPWMLGASTLVLSTLGIAEYIRKISQTPSEVTRKLVHILSGGIVLFFPLIFNSWLPVLVLTIGFTALMVIGARYSLFQSVENVGRVSWGSFVYPAAVCMSFFVAKEKGSDLYYYLPMLVLIVSDPLAAVVGLLTQWRPYRLTSDLKTLGGSIACFLSAGIIAWLLLGQYTQLAGAALMLNSIGLALLVTLAEAMSPRGLDNISIPFITLLFLFNL